LGNAYIEYLQACLSLIAPTLKQEESVLRIEEGQTQYGKQTFVYYKVLIATFEQMTGNTPVGQRTVVVQINVDPPNKARYVPESEWQPFQP
jgi:hypothetical protein